MCFFGRTGNLLYGAWRWTLARITKWTKEALAAGGARRLTRREADGGRYRLMGEGSRWDLGQVARRVVEGRRSRLGGPAARAREASAGPRTPAHNVISALC